MPLTPGQLTLEIPDRRGAEPPTGQMSRLQIQDIAPPDFLPRRNPLGRPAQSTQQASLPTWGQIKALCRQAQGIATLQGSSVSPEKVFIAMLALLSCQVSAAPIPTKYWAFLPDPPTFQVVTWNSDPIRVSTDQPRLLGGSYTSYTKDQYPINFNYTFKGLADDFPVCFNFPPGLTGDFFTKTGCVGASTKAVMTDSPTSKFASKGDRSAWILRAHMPGVLGPYKSLSLKTPSDYPNCDDVAPSDVIWKTIDDHSGYPIWKSCIYNSKIDYNMPGGRNCAIQDWSNPNPGQDPESDDGFINRLDNWKKYSVSWPLVATRRHHNQFVPPMLSYTTRGKTFWQPEIWRALAATAPIILIRPKNTSTYSILACLPSPYVFLFTNDSERLNIQLNYTGGPHVVSCEQCMLSSCLTPQYKVCSFMVLKRPSYLMVPVTVATYWYDNHGLAVLQRLQDLMRTRRFVGLLVLGISALITAITSVTVAALSLSQQVHTAQYVDTVSKNVSLTLATQEIIDRKLEIRVDALEEAVMHIGTELQSLKVKMALSCHADYRWICVTSLKVNETDFEWERVKNHILGVWNSSDISLDLGKLHNQIQTLEHSRLDFTAAGEANDFFHTFSDFISGKTLLTTVSSYAAVGAIILLLVIVLPCVVRTLRQSIQNLATDLHLIFLKNNKEGGDAGSQCEESRP